MKVTLYGASGMIGSRIFQELLTRKHTVKAIVRDVSKINEPNVEVIASDILRSDQVAELAKDSDAVISAYAPPFSAAEKLLEATRSLISGLKDASVHRLIIVGGAGGLEVSPGIQLLDTPDFPESWKPLARAHRDALEILQSADLDWTFFSPPAFIEPGERTGTYRLGTDQLIISASGESRISAEDFAHALIDELEQPSHVRQRFTIGY